jgi:RNA ligase-like protein
MARLSRECVITEKIDGTNAQIFILSSIDYEILAKEAHALGKPIPTPAEFVGDFVLIAGSRTRWIRPKNPGEKGDPDNYGFAAWVRANADELVKLGPGKHFGEWYGAGINSAYGLVNGDRRFALFNTSRWFRSSPDENLPGVSRYDESSDMGALVAGPACCYVVPVLYRGAFTTAAIELTLNILETFGSKAVPGFMKPEGIVVYHIASGTLFKKTIENDAAPKSLPGLTNPAQLSAGVGGAQEAFRQKVEA